MDWQTQIKQKADEAWEKIQDEVIQNIRPDNLRFNYRAEHNELVLSIGMEMGERLNADMEILQAALLLHDIGRSAVKKGHGHVGARMAGEILANTNFPQEKIADVKYAIKSHVGWNVSKPETLEACILWDADKLSKLGAGIILHKTMRLPLKGKNSRDAVTEFSDWLKTAVHIKNNMKTKRLLKNNLENFKAFLA